MELNQLEQKLINRAGQERISRLAVGAVIIKDKKLLILERISNDFLGGIDELPSGKVEENESFVAALKREVWEETGLQVEKVGSYLGHFDYLSKGGKKTRQFNFVVFDFSGFLRINPAEHQGYNWVDIGRLAETKLTKNIIDIVTMFLVKHYEPNKNL